MAAINKKFALILVLINLVIVIKCQVIRPECEEKCGNVSIPYPFGIGKDCAYDHKFTIICNTSYNPPKPFLQGNSLQLISISLDGQLQKFSYVATDCYNKSGAKSFANYAHSKLEQFYYSPDKNKFIAVGCDTSARLSGTSNKEIYASGCMSICYNKSSVVNGSCSGIGCCQTSLPKQLNKFNVSLESFTKHELVLDFNPCSYAFIIGTEFFNFSSDYLVRMPNHVPAVLDWAIGNQGCKEAARNVTTYGCHGYSECKDSDNGPGYRCFCSPGYAGNPYVPGGCVDINECENGSLNDCVHKCHNVPGNYTCSCPKWFYGDGKRNSQGCALDGHKIISIIIGGGVFLIFLVMGSLFCQVYTRKRRQKKLNNKYFKQNGGFLLQDKISKTNGAINSIKIFNMKELQKATDNFSEDKICGRGGFGTVYKGIFPDGSIVAIKKSKIVDQSQVEQFINEITVLSQINHRNVVKFVGCCLETLPLPFPDAPVPMLIYEFITNGTLNDHLHNEGKRLKLGWQRRVKIAAETAGVLAYLHSAHRTPIIHRDIKPTNILLDDDYTAKVSDFGASRLLPKTETEMCTMVQGTLGYLDPEYFRTSQLTDKSDVYSFGVVLAELLTGQKAVSFERQENDRSLVNYLLSSIEENRLLEILDKGMISNEGDNFEEMVEVADIARMCLQVKGEERPAMKEVGMELESILLHMNNKLFASDMKTRGNNGEEQSALLSIDEVMSIKIDDEES